MRNLSPDDFINLVIAVRWTLALAAIAFAGGGIGGLIIALARTSHKQWLIQPARIFIILFQGTPLLMQLFLCFFGLPILGFDVPALVAAGLALVLNASAFLGDIWRGCIQAVPKGQTEVSHALNLNNYQRIRYVIMPQAIKIAIPPTVGYLVQILKGTSLAAIIGFVELTRTAQVINSATFEPFKVFAFAAVLYFCMCWPLSQIARHLESRFKISE